MTRYGLCPGIMSFTKLLDGFSLGFPLFNSVALLHRLLTGLHPVDIFFLRIVLLAVNI